LDRFLPIREAAAKWEISERRIQQYCAEGRIPGAQKIGRSWAIPADAEKPEDPRRGKRRNRHGETGAASGPMENLNPACLMPLMNSAFVPGSCRRTAEEMPAGAGRDIALCEYYYFSGQPEEAAKGAEAYLTDPDMAMRLSACLIYAYANLSIGQIARARFALDELNHSLAAAGEQSPEFRAAAAFIAVTGAVLLHLPLPEKLPDAGSFLPLLPPGLRAFALYVQAHYLYLKGEYGQSAGIVEATLSMGASAWPIPAIYLHLVAVMAYMSLKQPDRARTHLLTAWEIARPDDLIEAFGEHHGLLGAMLEAVIKPGWPEDFKRIIEITYRFSSGWRRVHNPLTGHDVADDLTTTEFAIAMLAARGWTNQKIAEHLHISANTVKSHLSVVMKKLNTGTRKELKKYMLQ
jgi:DNA-binding CsgD family transcriptional regulator